MGFLTGIGKGILALGTALFGISGDVSKSYVTTQVTDTIEDTTSKIVTLVVAVVAFNYLTKK